MRIVCEHVGLLEILVLTEGAVISKTNVNHLSHCCSIAWDKL